MKKTIQSVFLIFGLLIGFQNCSMPELVEAKFERDSQEIINDLKALSDFEDAGIRWSATSFKEETKHILYIQLLNGQDLSEKDAELKEIGKKALKIVINSIENEEEYDKFQTVFIQKTSVGPVSKSYTKPFNYSLEELE